MKTSKNAFLLFLLFSLLVPKSLRGHFNDSFSIEQDQHFMVVIGAFAVHRNAERFAKRAHNSNYIAKYEFNPERNLYYVYTLTTEDKEQAMDEARRLREETSYTDAWVYQGFLGQAQVSQNRDIDPITHLTMAQVPTSVEVKEEPEVTQPIQEVKSDPAELEGKKFLFKLYSATTDKNLLGDIIAIDVDRNRKMGSYKVGEDVYLASPKSTSGKVLLMSDLFGYRKSQKEIDYNNPEGENVTVDENGRFIVPFELIRLRKGDIAVMYNVFFYKDAAVMLPESHYEVDNLLDMMKDNPKCKIRIHGHTNGNAGGKIISMGETKNFFSLTGTKEGIGSAKALSEARARIIQDYLIDNGIDRSRTEIKAWGGKRPIHDKESAQAKENVRVEIEILQD